MIEMTRRYVALGDSYTIGISVGRDETWPSRLAASLGLGTDGRPVLELVANLAANGRTSDDVRRDQLPRLAEHKPDVVSLLIGVNDVVQGVPVGCYRENVVAILDDLLARLPAGRLLAVTTPDYTLTPAGASFGDPATQRARIVEVNALMTELATARGIAIVDICDLAERVTIDPGLVARDGLHPSGRQYALWAERIRPIVLKALGGS
jgi:lysophospholipase L1-like esterase